MESLTAEDLGRGIGDGGAQPNGKGRLGNYSALSMHSNSVVQDAFRVLERQREGV